MTKQECIPVGCIPSAHWLHLVVFGGGGGCMPGDRVCLGVCMPGGLTCRGRGHACQGVCVPCTPILWTEFLTHACENITFPQLMLRAVISVAIKSTIRTCNLLCTSQPWKHYHRQDIIQRIQWVWWKCISIYEMKSTIQFNYYLHFKVLVSSRTTSLRPKCGT